MTELVKRSRDDVIAYLESFGLPKEALDSLRGSFDLWHERRVRIENELDYRCDEVEELREETRRLNQEVEFLKGRLGE